MYNEITSQNSYNKRSYNIWCAEMYLNKSTYITYTSATAKLIEF